MNKDLERINFLSNFIGLELDSWQREKILSETSIEKNYERSQKAIMAEKMEGKLFDPSNIAGHENFDNKIGPRHVDSMKGKIKQGKQLDRFIKQDILDDCEWVFDEFGYDKNYVKSRRRKAEKCIA